MLENIFIIFEHPIQHNTYIYIYERKVHLGMYECKQFIGIVCYKILFFCILMALYDTFIEVSWNKGYCDIMFVEPSIFKYIKYI